MDAGAQAVLNPWLVAGERLIWTGKPSPRPRLDGQGLFLYGFGLLWTVIALAVIVQAASRGEPLPALLSGCVFLLFGLYFTFGRWLREARLRRQIVYAVTDQRVIMLRTGRRARLRSYDLSHLPALDLTELSGGRGSIEFESTGASAWMWAYNPWGANMTALSTFEGIPDARRVYSLIRDAARHAAGGDGASP